MCIFFVNVYSKHIFSWVNRSNEPNLKFKFWRESLFLNFFILFTQFVLIVAFLMNNWIMWQVLREVGAKSYERSQEIAETVTVIIFWSWLIVQLNFTKLQSFGIINPIHYTPISKPTIILFFYPTQSARVVLSSHHKVNNRINHQVLNIIYFNPCEKNGRQKKRLISEPLERL